MLLGILCQVQNTNGIGNYRTSFNYDIFIRYNDLIITPFYVIIIIVLAAIFANQRYKNHPIRKYFLPGLIVKIIGGICVGLVYQFYYKGGGDTTIYYGDGKVISDLFSVNVASFFRVLNATAGVIDPNSYQAVSSLAYFKDPNGFLMDKIVGFIGLFTFETYTAIAVVLATLSFTGAWALYITFCKIYPNLYKQFAIAVLFIPSVFFWGSGILKDCVTFGCLGWFTYAGYSIFIERKRIISSLIILLISAYFIGGIKPYILLSFAPSFLFWVFLTHRHKIQNPILRNLITPFIIITGAIGGYIMAQKLGQDYAQYSVQNFVTTASKFQTWHGYLAENNGAAGYSLGTIDPTPLGALSKFPLAVNVTLFRPYLWEVHNAIQLIAAIESFFIFIFTIRIILRTGLIRFVKIIYKIPLLFFCIFFALLFAFAVGFTAYNFGALVRYKIPCIPFYVAALFILDYVTKQDKLKKKSARFDRSKPILLPS